MLLETDRLLIRKFSLKDLDDLFSILSDPEVMEFSVSGPHSREKTEAFLQKCIKSYSEQKFGLWGLVHKTDRRLIGYAGFAFQMVDGENLIELGYRLDKAFWGQGLASEACKAIVEYGFTQLHLDRIIAIIEAENKRSVGVALKLGMHLWKNTHFHKIPVQIYEKNFKSHGK